MKYEESATTLGSRLEVHDSNLSVSQKNDTAPTMRKQSIREENISV